MRDEKEEALRAAMAMAITEKRFDARWEDIAKSAGVSRATAFRRKDLREIWRKAIEDDRADSAAMTERAARQSRSVATKKELHRRLKIMAGHLEAMVSLLASKDVQIGMLERQLGGAAKVINLRNKS